MDTRQKNRYPFRLGTTSFIYPADYVTNAGKLAPVVDEIELLLFESRHLPDRNEISELHTIGNSCGTAYNVHLPVDIDLACGETAIRRQSIAAVARAVDRVAPLHPTTHTLHLTFKHTGYESTAADVAAWQDHGMESISELIRATGIEARRISIETLDFSPFRLKPIVEALDLSVCVDVGHVILHGFALDAVLATFASRTTILHLHGVSAGVDHLSLDVFDKLEPDLTHILSSYLNAFKGTVSIEVFNAGHLSDSLAYLPTLMKAAEGCTTAPRTNVS